MRSTKLLVVMLLLAAVLFGSALVARQSAVAARPLSIPRYNHIFVIVEENHSYQGIIGNPAAPTLNQWAQQYGLATRYFGTVHPSEGNYVAMLGANSYGIRDDNPYYTHTIDNLSIVSQLENAGLTWKGYFQSMPYAGYKGLCYPANCNGPLYASKHTGLLNFIHVQVRHDELLKLVPMPQLALDLNSDQVPNFSFMVPDQCHDMHGAPPFCVSPGAPGSPSDNTIVKAGDDYAQSLVNEIMQSSVWSTGNNAIVIIWDEGTQNNGCCHANLGGGRVPAIVITNHGPHPMKDNTPYNHYSLTATLEQAFGLGCIQFACDTDVVVPMTPLLAIS